MRSPRLVALLQQCQPEELQCARLIAAPRQDIARDPLRLLRESILQGSRCILQLGFLCGRIALVCFSALALAFHWVRFPAGTLK